jgi:hypothetical protein
VIGIVLPGRLTATVTTRAKAKRKEMRLPLIALLTSATAALSPAMAECDGRADIEAAFVKQATSKGWRSVITSKDANGASQEEIYEFLNPDRMYRKITTRGESIETIGISKWAWTNIGGGYSELKPQFAQMVSNRLQQAFVAPKVSVAFNCLGTKTVEGKEYAAYQTTPEKQDGGTMLARTIYLDPATGLPAYNIIGDPDGAGEPLREESFTYPDKITIEKP